MICAQNKIECKRRGHRLEAPLAFAINAEFAVELVMLQVMRVDVLAAFRKNASPAGPEGARLTVMPHVLRKNKSHTEQMAQVLTRCWRRWREASDRLSMQSCKMETRP